MPHTTVTEERLRSVVFEILDDSFGVNEPDLDSALEDIGIDSLGMTEMIIEIETRLDLSQELDSKLSGVDRTGTLGALVEHLHGVINSLTTPTS
jgi:acyl carrier protein